MDFTNLLANVANKTMMDGWAEENHRWELFSTRQDLPDLKPANQVFIAVSGPYLSQFFLCGLTLGAHALQLFLLPILTLTRRSGTFEPRGNLKAGVSRIGAGILAKDR